MSTNEKQSSASTRTFEQGQKENTDARGIRAQAEITSEGPQKTLAENIAIKPTAKHCRFKDLTGKRFGKLTVVRFSHTQNKNSVWLCSCDCGGFSKSLAPGLNGGRVLSCGCARREASRGRWLIHGNSTKAEHKAWRSMHDRCENPKHKSYYNYGGRGISVCERWNTFENFYADLGPRPTLKHSIDRIDNESGYSPQNCRWATRDEQANNKRTNCVFTLGGKSQTLTAWAKEVGVSISSIRGRMSRGWSLEQALTTHKRIKPNQLNNG